MYNIMSCIKEPSRNLAHPKLWTSVPSWKKYIDFLREATADRIGAPVYLAAVLEYTAKILELLELAGNAACDNMMARFHNPETNVENKACKKIDFGR